MLSVPKMSNKIPKNYLIIILSLQLAVLGVVSLEALHFSLPFVRPVIAFAYLSFVPGILILRCLRFHHLSIAETLCYSVGLSISSVMFTGLIVNVVGYGLGLSRPLSLTNLLIALTILTVILSFLSYRRDKDIPQPLFIANIAKKDALSPPLLLLLIIPLLGVLGALLVNFYTYSTILLFLLPVIALIPALIAFNKLIPEKLYGLAIFMISLALIYHYMLASPYFLNSDIQIEYYMAHTTQVNSFWNWAWPQHATNSCLSAAILPTIYSDMMKLDLAWVFKIVYPIFFSLVPLALYEAFRKQTSSRIAFLSAFFFVAFIGFVERGAFNPKQAIAEIFLALLILLIASRERGGSKKAILMITFSLSLIVSHYATSYSFMVVLILAGLLFCILRTKVKSQQNTSSLSFKFVMLFVVINLFWFMYTSGGVTFNTIVGFGGHVYDSLGEILNLETRLLTVTKMLGLAPMGSWERDVVRYLHWITLIFIIIGITKSIVKLRETKFRAEYIALGIVALLWIGATVVLPYFSYHAMGTARIYHFTLFFLAPFCILGGGAAFRFMAEGAKRALPSCNFRTNNAPMKFLALLVIIPYFLFNYGFVAEVAKADPVTSPFGITRFKESDSAEEVLRLYMEFYYLAEQDVASARWLSRNKTSGFDTWADSISQQLILRGYAHLTPADSDILNVGTEVYNNSYIYLNRINCRYGLIMTDTQETTWWLPVPIKREEISHNLQHKIYSNNENEIYFYSGRL